MSEQDIEKTAVIFRRWKGGNGGIIALFPEIPADIHGYYVLSYEHIGQHGAANYSGVIARTVPASEEEYCNLKQELESIGYVLAVYQKQTAKMRETCRRAVRK